MSCRGALFLLLVVGAVSPPGFARPMRLEETVDFVWIEDLVLSPDGRTLAFCASGRRAGENRFTSDLYVVPADDSSPERRLTRAPGNDCAPRFAPDGRRIAFVSDRSGADQVWVMPVDGGEPMQVTKGEGIGAFAWMPDGRGIVFTATPPPDAAEKVRRDRGDDARVYGEWPAGALWRVAVPAEGGTAGAPVRLSDGKAHVTEAVSVSPDGSRVAFIAQPTPEADASEEAAIQILEIASRKTVEVPASQRSSALAWLAGHDKPGAGAPGPGKPGRAAPPARLIFTRPFDGAGWSRLDLFSWTPGDQEPRNLSASVDRDIEQIRVAPDGSADVMWSRGTLSEVAEVHSLPDGVRTGARSFEAPWAPPFAVGSPTHAGWTRYFVRLDRPHEVWRVENRGAPRALTSLNGPRTAGVDLPSLETFRWKSASREVEGVLTVPPEGAASGPRGGPYPLLVRPHGGPRLNSLFEFGPQDAWLASLGYLVFEPNFRGSTGYGDAFAKANGGDWGAGPFADIMAGVDALIAAGRADPKRLYLYGHSYGGIMANWTATHTDRFRAIVSSAGVADLRMQYILSDARRWRFDYFGGSPFEERFLPSYWANSPVTQVSKVTTPVLFIQGEEDRRCPLPQALMMHRAILDNGGDSTLVIYPREGHGFREPEHILDRSRRIAGFFARHGGLPTPQDKTTDRGSTR